MEVAVITVDGTFNSHFVHAKQESEIMMILTSVLANLYANHALNRSMWSRATVLLANCATGIATAR